MSVSMHVSYTGTVRTWLSSGFRPTRLLSSWVLLGQFSFLICEVSCGDVESRPPHGRLCGLKLPAPHVGHSDAELLGSCP